MLTILAMIKDEHLYLPEWIEYHLLKGFSRIFLVEDFNSSSHKELVSKYSQVHLFRCDRDLGIYDVPENRTPWRQVRIYNTFFTLFPQYRKDNYCLFLDIDEFVNLPETTSLSEYINSTNREVYHFKLHNFNANGYVYRPTVSTPQAYTTEIKAKGFYCRTMLDVSKPYNFCCIQRGYISSFKEPLDPVIRINHYFTKSWEDWLIRMKRGSQNAGLRKLEDFFVYNPDLLSKKEELLALLFTQEEQFLVKEK